MNRSALYIVKQSFQLHCGAGYLRPLGKDFESEVKVEYRKIPGYF
jgi:hypothetical protein